MEHSDTTRALVACHFTRSGFTGLSERAWRALRCQERGEYGAVTLSPRAKGEGNPIEDATLLVDYANNIDLIMKDGVIYKNTLGG